ncbi:MAG TPA: hypothetical protein VMU69_08460, partial [Bradyrhizobium sp.]|nr:hypothetical protein [Bradyrhizobium sp.]
MKDDGSTGAMTLQPGKHQAQKILIAANDDPSFGERLDKKVGIGLRFHPQSRAWRDKSHDPAIPLNHDSASVIGILCRHG